MFRIMGVAHLICFAVVTKLAVSAPGNIVFPDDRRDVRKSESVITPPILPVLAHLERDPSTLREGDKTTQFQPKFGSVPFDNKKGVAFKNERRGGLDDRRVKPKFGFGGGFSVAPSGNGGLTASISSSASGAGASHSASQSFSVGFNNGFSASHAGSQSSSFNGFGSGFSGSQASSQAASFSGSGSSLSAANAASSSNSFGGNSASQSASSAFGFNAASPYYPPNDEVNFGEDQLDIRHRGAPGVFFPGQRRGKSVGAAAVRRTKPSSDVSEDILTFLLSD